MLFNRQWVFKENSARFLTALYLHVILTTGKKNCSAYECYSRLLVVSVKSQLRNLPLAVVDWN